MDCNDTHDAEEFGPYCTICGAAQDRLACWHCLGAGGFHACGEDSCCCLDLELDLNEPCLECNGEGSYWECPNVPHAPLAPGPTEGGG